MEAQTTQRNPLPHINGMTPDFKAMNSRDEISLSQFTQARKKNPNLGHLARAVVIGLAMVACTVSVVRAQTPLWGDNDYVMPAWLGSDATMYGGALVVLDEHFQFKGFTPMCQPTWACTANFGLLDWFANGDLLLGYNMPDSFSNGTFFAPRMNRQGDIIAEVTGGFFFYYPVAAYKVSFNDDIIVGAFGEVRRYIWDYPPQDPHFSHAYPAQSHIATVFTGGVAVVPRADGTHELWVAGDEDVQGIRIFPMDASGQLLQIVNALGMAANPPVPAISGTMTYDPATRRVLFDSSSASTLPDRLGNGTILAMDVETRTVVQTYTIPAAQRPAGGVAFTGITPGPNGIIVAVESYSHYSGGGHVVTLPLTRRIGLSVWDADGSNYRFIPLPAPILLPQSILWTRNSPAFRPSDTPVCGDGFTTGGEACDDGNTNRGDGCSAECQLETALDVAQQKCVNTLNKDGVGIVIAQSKVNLSCLKAAAAGKEANAQGCLTADDNGIAAKAGEKAADDATALCTQTPPFGFTSADSVKNATINESVALISDLFGGDLNAAVIAKATDRAGAVCQAAIADAAQDLASAKAKLFLGCKKSGLKDTAEQQMLSGADLEGCFDAIEVDAKGGIAKAATKIMTVVNKQCAGVHLSSAFPGRCADAADFAACVDEQAECRVCRLFNAMDGLSEDCDLFDDGEHNASCPYP